MSGTPTLQEWAQEIVTQAQRSYQDGRREGILKGHEHGYLQGYTAGFVDAKQGSLEHRPYLQGEATLTRPEPQQAKEAA